MSRLLPVGLRLRLILLVLLTSLPIMGLVLYSGLKERRHDVSMAQERALDLARMAAGQQQRIMADARQVLHTLAQLPQVRQRDQVACTEIFSKIFKETTGFTSVLAVTPAGDAFASAPPLSRAVNFSDRWWFKDAVKTGDFAIGEYLQAGRVSGKRIATVGYPVKDDAGRLQAVLGAGLSLGWLEDFLTKRELPAGSTIKVIDRKGTILVRYPERPEYVGQTPYEIALAKTVLAQGEGTAELTGIDGVPRLFGFTSLYGGDQGVYVSIGIPVQAALAEADQKLTTTLIWSSPIVGLALVAAWFFGGAFIVRPVNRLVEAARRLEDGDLFTRLGPDYEPGELGQLAAAFDNMTESLHERKIERNQAEEALRAAEKEKALILDSTLDSVAYLDTEMKVRWVNRTGLSMFPKSTGEYTGRYCYELWHQRSEPCQGCPVLLTLETGQPHQGEMTDSEWRVWLTRSYPVLNSDGEVDGVIELSLDITEKKRVEEELIKHRDHLEDLVEERSRELEEELAERKQAQEELQEKSEELERSNDNLKQFAYVASHDLQEPLRIMASYLQLLERRYQEKLDADGKRFIQNAVEASVRMRTLINDLLSYSRLDTRSKPFQRTDCEAILQQVLSNLQVAIESSGGMVTSDPLPSVTADPSQLTQLFQNLIGNAIKFRGEDPFRVHVSAERKEDEWVFAVSDNGIGLEPQYSERIFKVFQRLHSTSEYSGTGIGLAICKKIVERHKGRIWVESELGQGATFYFTIPDKGGS